MPSTRRVAVLLVGFTRGHRADVSLSRARTGGKCTPHYSRLGDLTPVIFVAAGGMQTVGYFTGMKNSAPLFFTSMTTNFAGLVLLALRPTVWMSSGPS